ncbi:unnamed protein product, partial [Aureobasidium vineae]
LLCAPASSSATPACPQADGRVSLSRPLPTARAPTPPCQRPDVNLRPWKREARGGPDDIQHCAAIDVLHPNRPNVSKDELRQKLSELYKADKDQVSVFGFRTQYGGGKSTGFALIYDSNEAMKKFEPHYRLVRVGMATKIEKASRQQRKQRKNRMKTLTGTAKVKGAKTKKDK